MLHTLESDQKVYVTKFNYKFGWTSSVISFPVGTECLLMSDWGKQSNTCILVHTIASVFRSLCEKSLQNPFDQAHNSSFFPRRVWGRNYNASSFQSILSTPPPEFKLILRPLPPLTLFFFKLHSFNVCQYTSKNTPYEPYYVDFIHRLGMCFFQTASPVYVFLSQKQKNNARLHNIPPIFLIKVLFGDICHYLWLSIAPLSERLFKVQREFWTEWTVA